MALSRGGRVEIFDAAREVSELFVRTLREERPWFQVMYRQPQAPLSEKAACELKELFDLVTRLDAGGDDVRPATAAARPSARCCRADGAA